MRRSEKEIIDKNEILSIIQKGEICRIALIDKGTPYIIPVNYGFDSNFIYIHSAKAGRKIDILKQNNQVCFEIEADVELIRADAACKWGMKYKSVIGYGTAEFIYNSEEKIKGLNILMRHYSDADGFTYSQSALDNVLIIRIKIDSMTGKNSGY